MIDPLFWQGRRVLVTGHTGFKGSWLALWLQALGAEVHGVALPAPTTPSLFTEASVAAGMAGSTLGDIRDADLVLRVVTDAAPDVVLHLAAQPLVRASYDDPLGTYATNVMGTAHVLDAVRRTSTVRAVVSVTTDKVYENREWSWGYREDDALGGHDPYSSSKAAAEIVTAAYRASFLAGRGTAVATARAGNVIGGGDWAADRLVPDALRALEVGRPVAIRHPTAVRPWQHVLEPLAGYLLLAERLHGGEPVQEAWNFGPAQSDARSVGWIVRRLHELWGSADAPELDDGDHPHEAGLLTLDASKATSRLGWRQQWSLDTTLDTIVAWHRGWLSGEDVRELCLHQIASYTTLMTKDRT